MMPEGAQQVAKVLREKGIVALLLVLTANNKLLGDLRNTRLQNIFAGIGLVSIFASSILLILTLTGVISN